MRQTVYDALIEIRAGYTDGRIVATTDLVAAVSPQIPGDEKYARKIISTVVRFAGFAKYTRRSYRTVPVLGLPELSQTQQAIYKRAVYNLRRRAAV